MNTKLNIDGFVDMTVEEMTHIDGGGPLAAFVNSVLGDTLNVGTSLVSGVAGLAGSILSPVLVPLVDSIFKFFSYNPW